ncbi:MAG TPA: BamA/TamA family outer membrane protein [Chitinivibrionales bacterium]|nr:BamA/TamA family outer membrane protein [Chitinivibrionales bacterium]
MNRFSATFIPPLAALLLVFLSVKADTVPEPPKDTIGPVPENDTIVSITINGNLITQSRILRMYLHLDSGAVFDSARTAAGQKQLMNTDLFSSVKVFNIRKKDGVYVYVLVKELLSVQPDYSFYYSKGVYGDTSDYWWKMRLGMSLYNFRGLFETLSIRGTFWTERGIGISWSKPFLPSPYGAGVTVDYNESPDLGEPRQRKVANGKVSFSRKLPADSRIYAAFGGSYNRIDSVPQNNLITSFSEATFVLGFTTDQRNRSFDPTSGWNFLSQAFTNAMYTQYLRYLQLYSDFRLYHQGFWQSNVMAYRLQALLRSNDAGPYRNLYMGGDGSVRGYPANYFGRSYEMNDYVILSAEYRFPLWTTPTFDAWFFSNLNDAFRNGVFGYINDMFRDFYFRVDGAVIGDAGHIWHDIRHPMGIRENGGGAGTGFRIIAPTVRRSLCFDIVWNVPGTSDPYHTPFYAVPSLYLYLDMYF